MINHETQHAVHSPLAVLTLTILSLIGNLFNSALVNQSIELMLHIAQLAAAVVAIAIGLQQLFRNLRRGNKQ